MSNLDQDRRRRYLIDKAFQGKYVALLVVFIVALGVAGILILMVGGREPDIPAAQANLNQAIVAMVMIILVFCSFTVWYGIRFSHRVVGPVYAFSRHLNWIREGNYTRDLKLRDKDEFQNLALVLNAMQAALRDRVRETIDGTQKVETGLAELAAVFNDPSFDRERAQDMIRKLRTELEAARVKNEGFLTR